MASEVQRTQVAAGDIQPGLAVPIYVVTRRLGCCPKVESKDWGVSFELHVIVEFRGDQKIYPPAVAKIPINFHRA